MAVTITVEEVKNGFATTVPDDEIQILIEIVSEADACMDTAGVSDDRQRMLKIYAVRHMCFMQSGGGKGNVTSQSAPSGASQSFSSWKGVGVNASPYGNLLKQLDKSGCVVGLLENDGPQLAIMSVGGKAAL
jgi:hypothetical protein